MEGANNTRRLALSLVDKERNRQESLWGEQNHPQQAWVSILGEEYGEYCTAVNEATFTGCGDAHEMIKELTHVAAVAVAAIECLIRETAS